MPRVAVVGVGAIGGVLAGLLEKAGHDITLCTRRPLIGLTVDTPDGAVVVTARNATDPSMVEPVDWVLVATKTYDAETTSRWFPALGGRVAVIQNGVEHRERFAPTPVVPVIIDCPAERRTDTLVVQRGVAMMRVEDNAEGRDFAGLFAGSPAVVEPTGDFVTAAWKKLCINCAGAISALVRKPAGVMHDEALGRLALEMVAECVAVGRAVGADLDDSTPQRVLDGYRASPPDSINSMLADRMAGRPMEVDARNGVIIRLGEKRGIATPANRMAVALLNAL